MVDIVSASSSSVVSRAVLFFSMSEPKAHGHAGVYLGSTLMYNAPFMLDLNSTLNPHISVIGMTGSGKTYLLRSIIVKSAAMLDYGVIVIDWNGEYVSGMSFIQGVIYSMQDENGDYPIEIADARLIGSRVCFDLSGISDEQQKRNVAGEILGEFMRQMRSRGERGSTDQILVLDEAWKIMGSGAVSQLYREARKFGVSIITATQLATDANNGVIANAATVFVFRIQNPEDQRILTGSNIISEDIVPSLSSMDVGECFVRAAMKREGDRPFTFFLKQVDGVDVSVCTIIGDDMRIELQFRKFEEMTMSLEVNEKAKFEIIGAVRSSHLRIDSASLAEILAKSGADRSEIVHYLRELGLTDKSIVASCARILDGASHGVCDD